MNRKGFTSTSILFGVVLLILVGGGYYFVAQKNRSTPFLQQSTTPNKSSGIEYAKGEILVAFNKGVTEEEALSLLNKYKLSLKSPQIFYKYIYVTLKTKDGKIDYYANRINELKLQNIKRVEVMGKGRTNVEPWILVDFEPAVSRSEIDSILQISDKLHYENGMYGPESAYNIIVPEGKEKLIAEQLSKEKIVRTAYVDTVVHITN